MGTHNRPTDRPTTTEKEDRENGRDEAEHSDVIAAIKEYEDVFRRIAATDLPVAEDAQRALHLLEGDESESLNEQ